MSTHGDSDQTDLKLRLGLTPVFSRPGESPENGKSLFPEESVLPSTAYQIVHDEAMLDVSPRKNLATFVTTWMEDEARRLYADAFGINGVEKDEYPKLGDLETKCWKMLAEIWNAPDVSRSLGTATVGSSEACMLGGLAMKRRWVNKRKAAGKDYSKPNLVMSSAVQVCWEKFGNYFDVELRFVPISREHRVLDGHNIGDYIDENTIGVVAIMGVTYTGMYEPVKEIAAALDQVEKDTGFDVPIHVDGASGGMIAPFVDSQKGIEWDFRLPRVVSINTSGHKYGLTYAGLGWVVWRDTDFCPDDLVFNVSYLGGNTPSLDLNFSKPGAQVLLQYYLFVRLGREGYREVQQTSIDVAMFISKEIAEMGPFELWNDGSDIPVFAWSMKEGYSKNWDLHDLAARLRQRGWMVPAYTMPVDLSDLTVQRAVVRNDMGFELASELVRFIREDVAYLDSLEGPMPRPANGPAIAFHH